ncbi:hypothetical protein BAE44_0025952, partial [Dichanthelium oligosanthes]
LTSASLVSDFVCDNKIAENLRGTLQHYNLHYNVALVSVKDFCAPNPANIQHQGRDELVAIGCCFEYGILMAARGQHTEMLGRLDCKLLRYSTCKITKAGIGGPLVDFDGKFLGMNFCGMDLYGISSHLISSHLIIRNLHGKEKAGGAT